MKISFYLSFLIILCIALFLTGCSYQPVTGEKSESSGDNSELIKMGIIDFPVFPWPPPKASASMVIPFQADPSQKEGQVLLNDVNEHLLRSLKRAGYAEVSYFVVPGGYVLVTRLEQITANGSPKDPGRWSLAFEPLHSFSLDKYIDALFSAREGFYRIVVFIVSPQAFSQSDRKISGEEAMDWLWSGLNKLPSIIGRQEYTSEFSTTALVYEFVRREEQSPRILLPGRLTGEEHLLNAGLLPRLERLR